MRGGDELSDLRRGYAFVQDARGCLVHVQGYVFRSLHQGQFRRRLVHPARRVDAGGKIGHAVDRGHGGAIDKIKSSAAVTQSVKHEKRRRLIKRQRSLFDTHAARGINYQRRRVLVLLPDPYIVAQDQHGARFFFFERR